MRRAIVGESTNPGPTSPHAGKATLERDMTLGLPLVMV
jgi:hypothetical protein